MRLLPLTTLMLVIVAVSCTPREDVCETATKDLVAGIQSYIDQFSEVTPSEFAKGEGPRSSRSVANALAGFRKAVGGADCDLSKLQRDLVDGLDTLHGEGVIAQTLATTLKVSLSSATTLGNANLNPQTVNVEPGRDLGEAIAGAIPGSTLRLSPGEFKVDLPLIVLESIALVGSGRDATKIVSTAPGAALISLGGAHLRMEALTLEHDGEQDASLLILRSHSFTIRDSRFAGAKGKEQGRGGLGLIAGAELGGRSGSKTRVMQLHSSEFIDNSGGGVLIDGDGSPTISKVLVRGSQVCGICFQGDSSGTLTESDISSNAIGVSTAGNASPQIEGNTLSANNVAILVGDTSKPVMSSNRYLNSKEAAMVFSEEGSGSTTGDSCAGPGLGIVLLQKSAPQVAPAGCAVNDLRSDAISRLLR